MPSKPTHEELEEKIQKLEQATAGDTPKDYTGLHSEDWYKALFDQSLDSVFINDLDGKLIDANPASLRLTGYSKKELASISIHSLIGERQFQQARSGLIKTTKDGAGKNLHEFRVKRKNGSYVYVEAQSSFINRNGSPYAIISVSRDINERKQAETLLRKNKKLMEQLAEAAWECIAIHDHGILLYANNQYYKMFGYTPEELLGKEALSKTTSPESFKFIRQMIEEGKLDLYEATGLKKDGAQFPIEVRVKTMEFDNKDVRVAAIRDISERKKSEEKLRKYHDQLEELVERRTEALEDANTALRIMLKKEDEVKNELEEKIIFNVKQLIMPYFEVIKRLKLDGRTQSYLSVMEANLNDITSPFMRGMHNNYFNLTPSEIKIANMVKQGKATKDISEILNLSISTVETHRRNIRKKMGIKSKKINLRSHLLAFQK